MSDVRSANETQKALEYLKNCPTIISMPLSQDEAALLDLAKFCLPVSHQKGEIVFWAGGDAHHLYLLCGGTVGFATVHLGGKVIPFGGPLEPGHFFGEVALLSTDESGQRRRTATCKALQTMTAVRLTWDDLKKFVAIHPKHIDLMELLVKDMANRLRRAGTQLAQFDLHDPNEVTQPKEEDLKLRTWAKGAISLPVLWFNLFLIVLSSVLAGVFRGSFDRIIGVLGCVVTIEALLVTLIVLNSQDRETTRQEQRVETQYDNIGITLNAVVHLQKEVKELRAELYPEASAAPPLSPAPPDDKSSS